MYVIKHDGRQERFNPNKTFDKIQKYSDDLDVDVGLLTQKVISGISSGIKTVEIDHLTSSLALHLSTYDTDYGTLAYRIERSCIDRDFPSFEEYVKIVDVREEVRERLSKYNPPKTFDTDYLGLQELIDKYLMRKNGIRYEKPEFMYSRVAAELDCDQETFVALLEGKYIHSSPLEFNAGQRKGQFGSCFILDTKDSVHGIDKMVKEAINTAARAGGIGINLNRIRPTNSPFNKGQGLTKGIDGILEHLESGFKLFNQGDRRKASIVIYLSPWHGDFMTFLKAGAEDSTIEAKSLFYGLWIEDYFMHCVKNRLEWKFVQEDLSDYCGDEFVKRYNECKAISTIRADRLWGLILEEQCSNRTSLYVCFKDHANRCSNLKDYGPILSSNLCTEIMEPQSAKKKEIAVCNLATICLSKFVKEGTFDFIDFKRVCAMTVLNVNKVIDKTYYSSKDSKRYNHIHRSLGIGLQGYQDMLIDLNIPFDSAEAKSLLSLISEHMYYNLVDESCSLVERGLYQKHESFGQSELAKGIFHFQHYFEKGLDANSLTLDWQSLRERVMKHGVANAHFVTDPPTAGTSKILVSSPGMEPYLSIVIKERISGREYMGVKKRVERRLKAHNLWTPEIVDYIKANGSLPNNMGIPDDILRLFKTAYQIDLNEQIEHRTIRQPFVDQAMSFNWFLGMDKMNPKSLNVYYFRCWNKGLKTASYYIHRDMDRKSTNRNIEYKTVSSKQLDNPSNNKPDDFVCTDEVCTRCSS